MGVWWCRLSLDRWCILLTLVFGFSRLGFESFSVGHDFGRTLALLADIRNIGDVGGSIGPGER